MIHARVFLCTVTVLATPTIFAGTPTTLELNGVVRDFMRSHPDFDVMPIGGPGHYAANVALATGPSNVPVFAGGGFKVATQWQDWTSLAIAPHMYIGGGSAPGVVVLVNEPDVHGNATVDTWDSSSGLYGPPDNVGDPPVYVAGGEMPDISAPTGLGPSEGDGSLDGVTIDTDRHFDSLVITGTVMISGDRVVYCEGDFTLATWATVHLMPDSTLSLYVTGAINLAMPHSNFNAPPNSGMPGRAIIYNLGTEPMVVGHPNSVIYATIIAPWAEMRVMPNSEFFGNFIGQDLDIQPGAGFHVDNNTTFGSTVCGALVNDSAGSAGVSGDAAVTSETTYAQWYREILGVNMAMSHSIALVHDAAAGVYEYLDGAFYPIDGLLFGNDGDDHNNYFTYTVEAHFTYLSCTGQFIDFMGSDDTWIFIDGDMVIDLGGITALTDQRIEIDRLGLVDDEEYTMHLFYAHRGDGPPQFNMRTNIELWSANVEVTASLPCD